MNNNKEDKNYKNKNWEEFHNYKSYRRSKLDQEEDIDFFECCACGQFRDSWDESNHSNICIDCVSTDEERSEEDVCD